MTKKSELLSVELKIEVDNLEHCIEVNEIINTVLFCFTSKKVQVDNVITLDINDLDFPVKAFFENYKKNHLTIFETIDNLKKFLSEIEYKDAIDEVLIFDDIVGAESSIIRSFLKNYSYVNKIRIIDSLDPHYTS